MPNTNGLTSLAPVYLTGSTSSNVWLAKNAEITAPTLVSPISVVSEDGTQTGTIAQNNNGNMIIYPPGGEGLFLGNGNVDFPSPDNTQSTSLVVDNTGLCTITNQSGSVAIETDSALIVLPINQTDGTGEIQIKNGDNCSKPVYFTTYCGGGSVPGTTIGNLQTFAYEGSNINKVLDLSPLGDSVILGSSATTGGANVYVDGPAGISRVYDEKYNTLPSVVSVGSFYTTPSTLITGTITEPIAPAVVPGVYMLQARVNLQRAQGGPAPVFGTSINAYLQTVVAPTQYLAGSAFNILPSMLFAPAENGDNDSTFTSGAFIVPAGSTGWDLLIEVDGSWNFNSGSIVFQLLRLA